MVFIDKKHVAAFFLIFLVHAGVYAGEAGKFLFVFGSVFVENAGTARQPAVKGMSLMEGATVIADKNGKAQIRMKDGGFLAVRPNTELKIDEYAFNDKGREDKGVVSLLKGTFRSISGAIGKNKPENVVVKTPVATIGIRGTDHEPAYFPANDASFSPDIKPGLYDKVNAGVTFIANRTGKVFLGPSQAGFVASPDSAPVKLPAIPAFYQQPNLSFAQDSDEEQQAESDQGDAASTDDSGNDETVENQAGETSADTPDGEVPATAGDAAPGDSLITQQSNISGDQVEQTIEATDSQGNTIDTTNQVVTDPSGNTSPIQPAPIQPASIAAVSFIQFDINAGCAPADPGCVPDPDFNLIEDAHVVDNVRQQLLKNTDGHIIGAVENDGSVHELRGNIVEIYPVASDGDISYGVLQADYLYDGVDNSLYPLDHRYWSWVSGPAYKSSSFSGTMNFSSGVAYAGPLNPLDGPWSQLSGLTGSMTMNLNANTISNISLNAGSDWQFDASGLNIDAAGLFSTQTVSSSALSVQYQGSSSQTYGAIAGGVSGAADAAMMSFAAKHVTTDPMTTGVGVTGVAVFRP